ncbi:MAG: hypothetical protein RLZZ70_441 [Candidatus Parcubacteria bacterium]|jgi:hypothetical protein
MINLIPASARRLIVREYWVRTLAVWMFLLGTGCLVVASLFLPTYVLVANQSAVLEAQVQQNSAESASFDSNAAVLVTAMNQANFLLASTTNTPFSTYETQIEKHAGLAISIGNFQFVRVSTTTSITIGGRADNRQVLAAFRDALEADPLFTEAVLPIASLIKDRDIDFTMTITGITVTP